MAWLEFDPLSRTYRLAFRFGGRRYKRSLRTADRREAQALAGGAEKTLLRLEQGLLDLPVGADLPTFVLCDGNRVERPKAPRALTLQELHDRYLAAHRLGGMEANSLATAAMHLRHFVKSLGARFAVPSISPENLQRHVERRAGKQGLRGRLLRAVTLRKEVASLRAAWNWAAQAGLLTGPFPGRGLKYPKAIEKPPFQTWAEVQRQVARGGLDAAEAADLWDALFLTLPEVEDLLSFVRDNARHPFLYPMFCFAAHTGARRSEMLRSRVDDIDLASRTVMIREKKRQRGHDTTRRVPLSPLLERVMRDWLAAHPGGASTFCLELDAPRSKKDRRVPLPLTRDEANDHSRRTLAGSKWERLRGWHVLRHSFASNCAARGVDQRLINAWMGHQTEEMVRRYRHLFPDQQRSAIASVFGNGE
jgi:integrase